MPSLTRRDFVCKTVRGVAATQVVNGPAVLQPVDEAAFISTNGTAQWGVAAIQNLALVGNAIPTS